MNVIRIADHSGCGSGNAFNLAGQHSSPARKRRWHSGMHDTETGVPSAAPSSCERLVSARARRFRDATARRTVERLRAIRRFEPGHHTAFPPEAA